MALRGQGGHPVAFGETRGAAGVHADRTQAVARRRAELVLVKGRPCREVDQQQHQRQNGGDAKRRVDPE